MTLDEAKEILAAFDAEGVELVVIGAIAMAARLDAERIREAFRLEEG